MVEVYLLRCGDGGQLAYRAASGPLGHRETPDQAAARIAQIRVPGPDPAVVLHSTSWRLLADGSIVLAYAVAPDPDPAAAAIPIDSYQLAHGSDAARPSPARVSGLQVAAHAACHLALVAGTCPQVGVALAAYPALSQALAALPRAPAGQFPA